MSDKEEPPEVDHHYACKMYDKLNQIDSYAQGLIDVGKCNHLSHLMHDLRRIIGEYHGSVDALESYVYNLNKDKEQEDE